MDSRLEELVEESRERFISRRQFMRGAMAFGLSVSAAGLLFERVTASSASPRTIKMGALIPYTGAADIFGPPMTNVLKMAVNDINSSGGLLGSKIELFILDDASNATTATEAARKLILQDNVDVIVGTVTSAERWAVALEVTDPGKTIYINPTYYEGGICNNYFFNVGAIPNQQIDPFIPWLMKNRGVRSFYLGGSDYAWPIGSFDALKATAAKVGAKIVGEEFSPLGTTDFSSTLRQMEAAKPDVIFPLYAGADQVAFLTQLISFGLQKNSLIASSGLDETDTAALPRSGTAGWLSSYEWFMSVDSPENKSYLKEYFARYGSSSILDAISVSMRTCVYLYANGVQRAKSLVTDSVIEGMTKVRFSDPKGIITIDPSNHCAYLSDYIAEIKPLPKSEPSWKQWNILHTYDSTQPVQMCLSAPPS
jgi:ABC-type branched-subunit amino acid transport system substrate-binding protein